MPAGWFCPVASVTRQVVGGRELAEVPPSLDDGGVLELELGDLVALVDVDAPDVPPDDVAFACSSVGAEEEHASATKPMRLRGTARTSRRRCKLMGPRIRRATWVG
jgi:hypothetical protein